MQKEKKKRRYKTPRKAKENTRPLEKHIKGKVVEFLTDLPNTWFYVNDLRALRGIPDVTACVHGTFVGLEIKKNRNATYNTRRSRLQSHILKKVGKAGGIGLFVWPDNWDKVKEILTDLSERGTIYDHTDIRTSTQQELRSGITKACEP